QPQQPREVWVVERFEQRDVIEPRELSLHDRAHVGIEVYREDYRDVRASGEPANRRGDRLHALAETLAPVAGDTDDPLSGEARLELGKARGELRHLCDTRGDPVQRSEERRVGKEGRCGRSPERGNT